MKALKDYTYTIKKNPRTGLFTFFEIVPCIDGKYRAQALFEKSLAGLISTLDKDSRYNKFYQHTDKTYYELIQEDACFYGTYYEY